MDVRLEKADWIDEVTVMIPRASITGAVTSYWFVFSSRRDNGLYTIFILPGGC